MHRTLLEETQGTRLRAPFRTGPRTSALLAVGLACTLVGCAPLMVEREGHRVFNPAYLWILDSSLRDGWQQPEAVLDALEISEGAVAADVGAGSGYFAERLAERVGPEGLVYATDVQDEMIEALERRVAERSLANVRVVRAAFSDPTLPEDCCDLVLFSSVYKEIDDRVAYMKRVAPLLRPGARVAILEFRPSAGRMGTPPADRLEPEQVEEELAAAGYDLVASHDFLPREYFLVFALGDALDPPPNEDAM